MFVRWRIFSAASESRTVAGNGGTHVASVRHRAFSHAEAEHDEKDRDTGLTASQTELDGSWYVLLRWLRTRS